MGKIQGQLDSPLTELGVEQAGILGRSLANEQIELIASSVLSRALKTAKIAQQHLACPLIECADLAERHFGDWQGQLYSDLKNKPLFNEVLNEVSSQAPNQGESSLASAQRLAAALTNIAKTHQQTAILVVSHGDILRNFLTQYLRFDQPGHSYGNCNVYAITYRHDSDEFIVSTPASNSISNPVLHSVSSSGDQQ